MFLLLHCSVHLCVCNFLVWNFWMLWLCSKIRNRTRGMKVSWFVFGHFGFCFPHQRTISQRIQQLIFYTNAILKTKQNLSTNIRKVGTRLAKLVPTVSETKNASGISRCSYNHLYSLPGTAEWQMHWVFRRRHALCRERSPILILVTPA